MFAILLSKGMDPFYQNISTFPTVIFTFVLAICVLYWLFAVLGVVDIDVLDIDGLDADLDLGNDATTVNALAGLMLRFGLSGIPVTIIVSFLSLFGWLISYYIMHYVSPLIPGGMLHHSFSLLVLFAAFWLAVFLTAIMVTILRPAFNKIEQKTIKLIIGKSAIVRTSKVTDSFGEAFLEDGGAGLILKVRSSKDQTFVKGDKIVLAEYLENKNTFMVVSEQDFNQ